MNLKFLNTFHEGDTFYLVEDSINPSGIILKDKIIKVEGDLIYYRDWLDEVVSCNKKDFPGCKTIGEAKELFFQRLQVLREQSQPNLGLAVHHIKENKIVAKRVIKRRVHLKRLLDWGPRIIERIHEEDR